MFFFCCCFFLPDESCTKRTKQSIKNSTLSFLFRLTFRSPRLLRFSFSLWHLSRYRLKYKSRLTWSLEKKGKKNGVMTSYHYDTWDQPIMFLRMGTANTERWTETSYINSVDKLWEGLQWYLEVEHIDEALYWFTRSITYLSIESDSQPFSFRGPRSICNNLHSPVQCLSSFQIQLLLAINIALVSVAIWQEHFMEIFQLTDMWDIDM